MKNFFKHPIVVSVISALIVGVIITPVVAYVKSQSFWEAIKSIGSFIVSIFNYEVPLWIIVLALIVVSLAKKFIKSINSKSEPHFTTYCKDVIDEVQWEWNWELTRRGYTFQPHTPVPYCRNCKGTLVVHDMNWGTRLVCENCAFQKDFKQYYFREYHDKVKREIQRRIRTNQWISKDSNEV